MTARDTQSADIYLPIGDVARRAGVSVDTIRGWDRNGYLTSIRTAGGHRRFLLSSVENYLAALAEGGDAA